jgi:hypothetical protein
MILQLQSVTACKKQHKEINPLPVTLKKLTAKSLQKRVGFYICLNYHLIYLGQLLI